MIAIINTGVANINSVANAIAKLGLPFEVTRDHALIAKSDHVILPGVGHAKASMKALEEAKLTELIRQLKQPLLGICLGMQLLYDSSEEGETPCLGLLSGKVSSIRDEGLPLPHMGWNSLIWNSKSHPLLSGIEEGSRVYFVHSFRAPLDSKVLAFTQYGEAIPAIVQQDNFFGTQFHPERSGAVGSQLLRNFLAL